MRSLRLLRGNTSESVLRLVPAHDPHRVDITQTKKGSAPRDPHDTHDHIPDPMSPATPDLKEDLGRTQRPEADPDLGPDLGLGLALALIPVRDRDPILNQGRDPNPGTGPDLCPHPETRVIQSLQEKENLVKVGPQILRRDQKAKEHLARDCLLSRRRRVLLLSRSATALRHRGGSLGRSRGSPRMSTSKRSKQK